MQQPASALGIIPARFGSTRLPGKPLVELLGKTMIQRVWEGALQSRLLDKVIVATDDVRIMEECRGFGAEVVMTSPTLPSGTDRIAEAYRLYMAAHGGYSIVVNIQGDEPLIQGKLLDALVQALSSSRADVATPIHRISSPEELLNPSVVKVVLAKPSAANRSSSTDESTIPDDSLHPTALYFSRSPIPHIRDVPTTEAMYEEWIRRGQFWKHIGIYAYTTEALLRFQRLPPSHLEQTEQLEQLRLLEDGAVFVCVETTDELISIDTPEDVKRVSAVLAQEQQNWSSRSKEE
jgi:3-deoxy-manno-octulosonate cytidylyltransferase (CMP-KDO synthetase)